MMTYFRHQFCDPYRSSIQPVIQPWIVPGRRALIHFRRLWPPLRLLTVCGMLVIVSWPILAGYQVFTTALVFVGLYLIFQLIFRVIEYRPYFSSQRWQYLINIFRHLGGVLGLSIFVWFVPDLSTQAWLLYLIPLLTIGVSLERNWAFALVALTLVCLFLSAFVPMQGNGFPGDVTSLIRDGLLRAAIGSYIGFTSYMLVRCLAYQHQASRVAIKRLLEITPTTSWKASAHTVAKTVALLFGQESHPIIANVLTYEQEANRMRVIGSSEPNGKNLADEGFSFSGDEGISGWAASRQKACFLNDTRRDYEGRFLHQRTFDGTRSALAVPFALDEHQVAVLEVESPLTNDFAQEDLQLLEVVGSHLVASHHRIKLLTVHSQLAQLGHDLANYIIRDEGIRPMLARVATSAMRMLDAHVIGFYYRHPTNTVEWERYVQGALYAPEVGGSPANDRHSLLHQLFDEKRMRFFEEAQNETSLTTPRPWHIQHRQNPFVLREGIVSCAVIPLVVAQECIGLMWINYRRKMVFGQGMQNIIQLLAPYAALSIQSNLQSALVERKRRERLRRIVHDSLAHRLHDVARAIEMLDTYPSGDPKRNEELLIARSQVERARRVVANLVGERPWLTLQAILDDLSTQVDLITKIHSIPVKLTLCEVPETPISLVSGNELMFTCDEILGNAVRYSQATSISIAVNLEDHMLRIAYRDDGVGFDPSTIRIGHGLTNIRERVDQLGGVITIDSAPGSGTSIVLAVPIPYKQSSENHNGE
ncbi:MAG: GAF domain-containing protein [Chloroflexi bacterium]|nr:GAF domain-containing protein [Chloroflexota bacterium]